MVLQFTWHNGAAALNEPMNVPLYIIAVVAATLGIYCGTSGVVADIVVLKAISD